MPHPQSHGYRSRVKASMTEMVSQPVRFARKPERPAAALARRLAREVDGEVLFDAASRGRYATDASIYQVMPLGVVVPRNAAAAIAALEIAAQGGMAGNNSCGSRSLAYGNMVDRVEAIDAWLPGGIRGRFDATVGAANPRIAEIGARLAALFEREHDEIARRFPKVARRVAGYNLDRLAPGGFNLAKLLVGSEGTLAWFERIHL